MDKLVSLINEKTLDMILSDWLLLSGVALVILGVGLFLFAALKFFLYKEPIDLVMPSYEPEEEPATPAAAAPVEPPTPAPSEPEQPEEDPQPSPALARSRRMDERADLTMVMAPGVSDLQAQFEIAITQIKQLNKKVYELEKQVDTFATRSEAKLEPHELKEPPMDAGDFTKKLLKVVEHVIILEKEVNLLKAKDSSQLEPVESGSTGQKPTIMPL